MDGGKVSEVKGQGRKYIGKYVVIINLVVVITNWDFF